MFCDIDVDLILRRLRRQAELIQRHMRQEALTVRWRWRQRSRTPFTDAEAALILERSGALQRYHDQLAERMRPLQPAEDEEARDKASSGSDLALAVIAL